MIIKSVCIDCHKEYEVNELGIGGMIGGLCIDCINKWVAIAALYSLITEKFELEDTQ